MFERHTKELRKALFTGMWTVKLRQSSEMEPEHLLAAILYLAPDCAGKEDRAWKVLQELGYPDVLEGPRETEGSFVPFSSRTRSCLADAAARADRLGHRWVRSEHLLASFIAEGGAAGQALLSNGLDAEALEASALLRAPDELDVIDTGPSLIALPGRINGPRKGAI